MMAAIADATHMTTVSRNSPTVNSGVMTIGSANSAVALTMTKPIRAAMREPDHGAEQGLADDDLMNVIAGRAHGAQGCKFVQMILGAGIKRLRHDDGADDDAEQGAREQSGAGAGIEQPEDTAAIPKLRGREDLDIGEICLQPAANPFDANVRRDPHQEIGGLARGNAGIGACPINRSEDIGRGGEGTDALGDRHHLHFLIADLGDCTQARDSQALEIALVDRHRIRDRRAR